jgi:hypothetical protein
VRRLGVHSDTNHNMQVRSITSILNEVPTAGYLLLDHAALSAAVKRDNCGRTDIVSKLEHEDASNV